MKKVLPLILAIFLPAALASCDGDYDFKPRKYRFQTMPAPGEKQQAVPPEGALYITCAEFPEGYDYRTDPDYGSVEATLVLFADGSRITSLAAGPGSAFSIDPDMHRVRGGHLYTDGVDGNGTVFHRDGEKIFSYEGRESVRGFMVIDNKVHTLGQSRSGGGFSYRINGQLVFSRKEGYILGDMSYPSPEGGALRTDGKDSDGMPKIYFSYGIM